jgi:hypothetical protein
MSPRLKFIDSLDMSSSCHRTITGLVEPSFEDPIILVVALKD